MIPIDSDTYNRVCNIIAIARRTGTDAVEELHRSGLILTPTKEQELRTGGMEFLLRQIYSWRPAEFLRMKFPPSRQASPADMYSCIVEFIEQHIAAVKKGS